MGQDFTQLINDAAAKTQAAAQHHDGPSPAQMETMQSMQATSREQQQWTQQYQSALKEGRVGSVLEDNIRKRILGALPSSQRELYQDEERQYGASAAQKGPAHRLVDSHVADAEHLVLGQAIRQAGLGKLDDINHAVRVFQNPQAATREDWIKLGITVGSHGMLPPEVSNQLSHALALESGRFFSGSGTGSFADLQVRLQVSMKSLKPITDKLGTAAGDAAQTGKQAATGMGKWFKGHVIDPTKKHLQKDQPDQDQ